LVVAATMVLGAPGPVIGGALGTGDAAGGGETLELGEPLHEGVA